MSKDGSPQRKDLTIFWILDTVYIKRQPVKLEFKPAVCGAPKRATRRRYCVLGRHLASLSRQVVIFVCSRGLYQLGEYNPGQQKEILMMQVLQPPDWAQPRGYSNGIAARGRMVFVAGQVGWDGQGRFQSTDFTEQVRQALKNVVAVLAEAGGEPAHIVRMTWYVTSTREYLDSYKSIGGIYREIIGKHYPAMTAVQVAALIEDGAKVEIEATAVIPD